MGRKAILNACVVVLGVLSGLAVFLLVRSRRDESPPRVVGLVAPPLHEVVSEAGLAQAVALADSIVLTGGNEAPSGEESGSRGVVVLPPSDDVEWSRMRVERYSVSQYLGTSAAYVSINKLMRHAELNPRDRYFSPAKRKELMDVLAPMQSALMPIMNAQHDIASAEMSDMIDRGGTHTVQVADGAGGGIQSGSLPGEAREFNVFRRVGNTIHMANRDRMPGSAIAEQLIHAKNAEVACAIAGWFFREGALTPDELHQLLIKLNGPVTWNGR